jgi:hypothetical protein
MAGEESEKLKGKPTGKPECFRPKQLNLRDVVSFCFVGKCEDGDNCSWYQPLKERPVADSDAGGGYGGLGGRTDR